MELIKLIFKTRDVTKFPEYPIFENERIWVGRCKDKESSNDLKDLIQIDSLTVSHRHALISHAKNPRTGQNEFWLEDHSRYHTTFLNGVRIQQPVRLKDKDQVTFGSIQATIEFQEIKQPDSSFINQTIQRRNQPIAPEVSEMRELTQEGKKESVEKITVAFPAIPNPDRHTHQQFPTGKIPAPGLTTATQDMGMVPISIPEEELEKHQPLKQTSAQTISAPQDPSWIAKDISNLEAQMQNPALEGAENPIPVSTIYAPPGMPSPTWTTKETVVAGSTPIPIPSESKPSTSPFAAANEETKFKSELIILPYAKIISLENILSSYISLNEKQEIVFTPANSSDKTYLAKEYLQFAIEYSDSSGHYQLKRIGPKEVRINGNTAIEVCILRDGDLIQWGSHSFYFFDGSNGDYSPLQTKLHQHAQSAITPSVLPYIEPIKTISCLEGRIQTGYRIFGDDPETLAFFSRGTDHGHYLFLGEILTNYPNYWLLPWLQGIFDLVVDDMESCVQILRRMNSLIVQNCGTLPVRATLLRLTKTEISYCSAQGNGLILQKPNGTQEMIFTRGMMLGLSREIFLEESPNPIKYQPEQAMIFVSHSYFNNLTKTTSPQYANQQSLQEWIKNTIKQYGITDLLNHFSPILEEKIQITTPFLLSTITLPTRQKFCPKCKRTFPAEYNNCPYDQSLLEY